MLLQPGQNSEWRRYSWSPPFTDWHYGNGDRVVIDGDVARHERNGDLIDVRPTTYVVESGEVEPVYQPPGIRSELFVEVRFNMAAVNSVLTDVSLGPDGETYNLVLDDGSGHPFTKEQMQNARTELQSQDHLVKFLAADLISREPDLENMDATCGTMVTYNAAADQPFVIARNL